MLKETVVLAGTTRRRCHDPDRSQLTGLCFPLQPTQHRLGRVQLYGLILASHCCAPDGHLGSDNFRLAATHRLALAAATARVLGRDWARSSLAGVDERVLAGHHFRFHLLHQMAILSYQPASVASSNRTAAEWSSTATEMPGSLASLCAQCKLRYSNQTQIMAVANEVRAGSACCQSAPPLPDRDGFAQ